MHAGEGPPEILVCRKEIVQFHDRKRNRRRAPKLKVISKPGKPLGIDFGSLVEVTRFMSAFGTSEIDHANLMLYGIVNAACAGSRKNPPSEHDINRLLAAVTGIGDRRDRGDAGDTDGGDACRCDRYASSLQGC
jgi:hypothetical protein